MYSKLRTLLLKMQVYIRACPDTASAQKKALHEGFSYRWVNIKKY